MLIRKSTRSEKPLISVVCLTFNQEKFIAQAIESFVSQKTVFPYEIIIHDDASTDGTLAIVREYQEKYPEIITLIEQSVNIYSQGVRVPAFVFLHARGEFIAYCEGDDYWCDPNKMQLQAEILLNNPKCGAVFTNKNVLFQESGRLMSGGRYKKTIPRGDVKSELVVANQYSTCTSMFRVEAVFGYEEVAKKLKSKLDDYVMWLFIAKEYEIEYVDQVTATYRVSRVSASQSPHLEVKRNFFRSTYKISSYFNKMYGGLVADKMLKQRYQVVLVEYCLSMGFFKESLNYLQPINLYFKCALRVFARKFLRRVF